MVHRRRFLKTGLVGVAAISCQRSLFATEGQSRTVRSPITNRWPDAPQTQVAAEDIEVFRGYEGQSFSHQTQLTSHDGRLYLTWSLGIRDEEGPGQRMVLATSDDAGKTWSKPMTVAPSNPGKFADSVVISSGLRVHDNKLIAYYGEWERSAAGVNADGTRNEYNLPNAQFNKRTSARVSVDGGQSWSDPILLFDYCVNYMPPQPLADGRLIFPGNLIHPYTDDPTGLSGWNRAGVPGLPPDYRDDYYNMSLGAQHIRSDQLYNEAAFFETNDGLIRMMLRNEKQGLLGVAESRDRGETWNEPRLTSYTDAICRSQFGRLPDGRYFGLSCPQPPRPGQSHGVRTPVVLAISEDGIHFDKHLVLGNEPEGQPRIPGLYKHGRYGYPYLHIMDEWAFVSYSRNKEDICVLRFPRHVIERI